MKSKQITNRLILLAVNVFYFASLTSYADDADIRPIQVNFESCSPKQEICGNGIDDDCDGIDAGCPGSDLDHDGFNSSNDCNDQNSSIYPGVSVSCNDTCGVGTKICNSTGSYSECSCTPLCEAVSPGRCYYVDPDKGLDTNTGSFTSRLKTLLRFGSYSGGTPQPINKISLNPGDVVYLFSGVYSNTYMADGSPNTLKLISVSGTSTRPIVFSAYPDNFPIIQPSVQAKGFIIQNANYLKIKGLTFKNNFRSSIWLENCNNTEISRTTVRDTDGIDNNNMAGIYSIDSSNTDLNHSFIFDNYDRSNSDTGGNKTENSRNIVLFGGGSQRFSYNTIYQTPVTTAQKTGACLVYKHSQTIPNSIFEVDHNVFSNCYSSAIGTSGSGGRFHHNLFLNSDIGVYLHVYGQSRPPYMGDNWIDNNTFINTPTLMANLREPEMFGGTIGPINFRNNLIRDNNSYGAGTFGIVTIDIYGSNDLLNRVRTQNLLTFSGNCYSNTNTSPMFNFFGGSLGASSNQGGLLSFSTWQGQGYDTDSVITNPNLTIYNQPQLPACANKGYLSGW